MRRLKKTQVVAEFCQSKKAKKNARKFEKKITVFCNKKNGSTVIEKLKLYSTGCFSVSVFLGEGGLKKLN